MHPHNSLIGKESTMHDLDHQSPVNRRNFLQTAGAFAMVFGLRANNIRIGAGLERHRSLADLHYVDFEAVLGQSFSVYAPDALPRTVRLDAVKQRTHATHKLASPRHEWFSLAFTGPRGQALHQGTYTFVHPQLGQFELFVVPAEALAHEERHIAIINRI
jgi:hypothetical protein